MRAHLIGTVAEPPLAGDRLRISRSHDTTCHSPSRPLTAGVQAAFLHDPCRISSPINNEDKPNSQLLSVGFPFQVPNVSDSVIIILLRYLHPGDAVLIPAVSPLRRGYHNRVCRSVLSRSYKKKLQVGRNFCVLVRTVCRDSECGGFASCLCAFVVVVVC